MIVSVNLNLPTIAGSDTTVSVLHSCILSLILNQDIQSRAHAELDVVLGSPTSPTFRLPTHDDRSYLPYIDAILKESLRWLPVVATGIPHATTKEDIYRGWRIPKGSIVIANAWGMLHDENMYPDSFVFRPERFIEREGKAQEPDPGVTGAFGFGRRYVALHIIHRALLIISLLFRMQCVPRTFSG